MFPIHHGATYRDWRLFTLRHRQFIWTVGNMGTTREPMQPWREHSKSTQKGTGALYEPSTIQTVNRGNRNPELTADLKGFSVYQYFTAEREQYSTVQYMLSQHHDQHLMMLQASVGHLAVTCAHCEPTLLQSKSASNVGFVNLFCVVCDVSWREINWWWKAQFSNMTSRIT